MVLQRTRRAAAALALAATLALVAPAHAAGWESLTAGPGWLGSVLEWITSLWLGGETTGPAPALEKYGSGMDPNGSPTPPPTSSSPSGSGSGG